MKQMIEGCGAKSAALSNTLLTILNSGLAYRDGCVLLKSQLRLAQSDIRKRFEDDTGYECFVNDVHLEDLLASSEPCFLLEQALAFAHHLQVPKGGIGLSDALEYIISGDEDGMNVRFHVIRPGQNWLAEDLESYEEAVAAIRLEKGGKLGGNSGRYTSLTIPVFHREGALM